MEEMKIRKPQSIIFLCVALLSVLTMPAVAKEYLLYYLGGQCHMEGFGRVSELPEELQGPGSNVWIFHGNKSPDRAAVDGRGVWSQLRPGHGCGFHSDGKKPTYSDRFGVELTFARRLQKLHPNANIALIKYAKFGTSIEIQAASYFGCWEPDFREGEGAGRGVNQYDHFLATVRNAFSVRDIDGDGEEDTLTPAGIVWMQGESDASFSEEIAKRYEANLKRMMDLIRAALRSDDLPVAIGRITGKNWVYLETVRAAQASFVESDERATLVTTTDNYKNSDPYHYDSAGYIDLGAQFAEAISRLNKMIK
jgi:hypothetical protein